MPNKLFIYKKDTFDNRAPYSHKRASKRALYSGKKALYSDKRALAKEPYIMGKKPYIMGKEPSKCR